MEMGLTVFYLLTLVTVIVIIIRRRRRNMINRERLKSPPEADGGWPIIGHLRLLSGGAGELPHIVLSNMADKYGPIFGIRLGVQRALIVSTSEIAKECYTGANDVVFSNRPKTAAIQHMSYNFGMFGFNANGAYWRELRKISMLTLLSNARVASLGRLQEVEVGGTMRSLYSSCGGGTVAEPPLEMKKVFGDLALNLMVRILAGDDEKRRMDESEGGWHRPMEEFFRMVGVVTLPDVIPFLRWLDDYVGGINYYYRAAFRKTAAAMDGILQSWLEEHKKDDHVKESFMGEMMAASDKLAREFPRYDADTITKATCQSMILGGTDTMTLTLTWALCLLLNNRHTISKAQQELDTHIGRGRQVKASDIKNLVYIKAIIKETLRLHPPSQLLARESSEDCTVVGYHVPAGTWIIVNIWKLHRDPQIWPDPLEFKPERFLTSHKEVDVRGQHFELLPFGSGRRICPGISFALQVMEYALASLLHGFDIETVPLGGAVDMTVSLGVINMKATPLEVVLTPRLAHHLYA